MTLMKTALLPTTVARRIIGYVGVFVGCLCFGLTLDLSKPFSGFKSAFATSTLGEWSSVMDWPVLSIHSVITADGNVLSFGADAPPSTATGVGFKRYDIWDPATDLHTTVFQDSHDYFCSIALNVADSGGVLIAGGDDFITASTGVTDASLFDPTAGTVTGLPSMTTSRWYPTGTTLPNGEIVLQGGLISGSDYAITPEIYNVNTGWRLLSGATSNTVYGQADGETRWWYPRSWVDGNGDIFGIAQSLMYTLDPSGSGSLVTHGQLDAAYRGGATSTAVMYLPGKILQVGGGGQSNTDVQDGLDSAVSIDISSGTPVVTPVSSMNLPRHWANATVLPNGQVLVNGGSEVNNTLTGVAYSSEIWDPTTDTWTIVDSESEARLYHSSSVLLPDGRVLSAGGGSPGPVANLNAQLFTPPYLFDAAGFPLARPTILWAPKDLAYGSNFDIVLGAGELASRVTLVKTSATTHSFNADQRFIELSFNQSGDQLTITPPATSIAATPGYYLLSVIDGSGVVSESKVLSLKNDTLPGDVASPPVDVSPPTVAITMPSDASTVDGPSVEIAGTANDDVGVATVSALIQDTTPGNPVQYWNGSGWSPGRFWNPVSTASTSWLDSFNLPSGDFRLQVTASDAAENLSYSDNVFFTVGRVFMDSPEHLAKFSGSTQAFSWTPAAGVTVTDYQLVIGSSQGGSDYYDSGSLGDVLSVNATGLPTNGIDLWVRLNYLLAGGGSGFTDVRYTAAGSPVQIDSPAADSTLTGSSVEMTWSSPGTDVIEYWVYAGATAAGSNYFDSGSLGTAESVTITGLPTDGSTVHVTLWYSPKGGAFEQIFTTFVAGGSGGGSGITSPVPGTTLSGSSETFDWSVAGSEYWVYAGSTIGSAGYYNSGNLGASTSVVANGLPTNGETVWIRLWSLVGGSWEFLDEQYTAAGTGGGTSTEITSPIAGSTLASTSETFSWTSTGTENWIYAGPSIGSNSYFDSGNIAGATSVTVSGLPSNGTTIWVRLWYLEGGSWAFVDEQYTATSSGGGTTTEITSPVAGSTLTSTVEVFDWTTTGSESWIYAGSTVGSNNYFDSGNLASDTSVTVSGLPNNGSVVWVRLWYLEGGSWNSIDEQYTAIGSGGSTTEITAPDPGTVLTGTEVDFTWTSIGSEHWIYAGSAPGDNSYFDSGNLGAATMDSITGLPTGSVTVWVRLWYLVGSEWLFIDESYTSAP